MTLKNRFASQADTSGRDRALVRSSRNGVREHPEQTGDSGAAATRIEIADALKSWRVADAITAGTPMTRQAAVALANVVRYLAGSRVVAQELAVVYSTLSTASTMMRQG